MTDEVFALPLRVVVTRGREALIMDASERTLAHGMNATNAAAFVALANAHTPDAARVIEVMRRALEAALPLVLGDDVSIFRRAAVAKQINATLSAAQESQGTGVNNDRR